MNFSAVGDVSRDKATDATKGFGIILMAFGHTYICLPDTEIFRIIYSFHVPLFFFLAGFFLKPDANFFRMTKSRVASLLKPVGTILLITLLCKIAYGLIASRKIVDVPIYFLTNLWGTGGTLEWVPLWFLPHLFLALALASLAARFFSSLSVATKNIVIPFASLMLIGVGISTLGMFWKINPQNRKSLPPDFMPGLPWSFDLLPITVGLIILGWWFYKTKDVYKFTASRFLTTGFAFFMLHWFFDETMDLNTRVFGNALIVVSQAFFGIHLSLMIGAALSRIKFLSSIFIEIGQASLFVLIFHIWFGGLVFWLLQKYDVGLFTSSFIGCIFGVVFSYFFWIFTKNQSWMSRWFLNVKETALTRSMP